MKNENDNRRMKKDKKKIGVNYLRITPTEYLEFMKSVKDQVSKSVLTSIKSGVEFDPCIFDGERYFFDTDRFLHWSASTIMTDMGIEPTLQVQAVTSALGNASKTFPQISLSFVAHINAILRAKYQNDVQVVIKGGCAQYILLVDHPDWDKFEPFFRFNDVDVSVYINPLITKHSFDKTHRKVSDIIRMNLAKHKEALDKSIFKKDPDSMEYLKITLPQINEFRQTLINTCVSTSAEVGFDIQPVLGAVDGLSPPSLHLNTCSSWSSERIIWDPASDPILAKMQASGTKLPPPFAIEFKTAIFVALDQTYKVLRRTPIVASSTEDVQLTLTTRASDQIERSFGFHFALHRLKWMFSIQQQVSIEEDVYVTKKSCARAHFLDISVPKIDDHSLKMFWSSSFEKLVHVNYMGRINLPVMTLQYAIEELDMIADAIHGDSDTKREQRIQKRNLLAQHIKD